MIIIPFEYELRLAQVENNYLNSLLTLLFNINAPIVDKVGLHVLSHQQQLEQMRDESPGNRARVLSIRKKTSLLISELLSEMGPKLREYIGNKLHENSQILSNIDDLSDEEYRKLDTEILDAIETQGDFFDESLLSLHQLLAKIVIGFFNNRQKVDTSLRVRKLQRVEVSALLIHYAEEQTKITTPLTQLLLQLNLITQAQIAASPLVEQEFVWLDKDAYFQLAKIEQEHLAELLDVLRLITNSNDDYWDRYEHFENLTSRIDFYGEEAEDLAAMQDIEEMRADIVIMHQDIVAKIIAYFTPLVTEKKKEIHVALANLVEAKSNFSTIDSSAGLQYPRRNFLLTPFTAIKSTRVSLQRSLIFLESPLQTDVTFKKTRAAIEDLIERNLTDGRDIGNQLRSYQQQLATEVGKLNYLWLQFSSASSISGLCAKAHSLYELSHPLQKMEAQYTSIEEIMEPPLPPSQCSTRKRMRDTDDIDDAFPLLPKTKAPFLLFNQRASETMEFHDLPKVGNKMGS